MICGHADSVSPPRGVVAPPPLGGLATGPGCLRDLVNLYLAGAVPEPWPSRLGPPGYGPKTERWKHLSIDQGVLCRL